MMMLVRAIKIRGQLSTQTRVLHRRYTIPKIARWWMTIAS